MTSPEIPLAPPITPITTIIQNKPLLYVNTILIELSAPQDFEIRRVDDIAFSSLRLFLSTFRKWTDYHHAQFRESLISYRCQKKMGATWKNIAGRIRLDAPPLPPSAGDIPWYIWGHIADDLLHHRKPSLYLEFHYDALEASRYDPPKAVIYAVIAHETLAFHSPHACDKATFKSIRRKKLPELRKSGLIAKSNQARKIAAAYLAASVLKQHDLLSERSVDVQSLGLLFETRNNVMHHGLCQYHEGNTPTALNETNCQKLIQSAWRASEWMLQLDLP
jgi:hypothetical protein